VVLLSLVVLFVLVMKSFIHKKIIKIKRQYQI